MSALRNKQRGEGKLGFIVIIACIASWFTHVVVCLSAGKWGFEGGLHMDSEYG